MSEQNTWQPGTSELPMVDLFLPMVRSAALIAAGELGLFEALANGPLTVPQLAEALSSSERGVSDLARFLGSCGYLVSEGEAYANAPHAQRWFTSQGEVDYSPGLRWSGLSWKLLGDLADAIRRGGPEQVLWDRMADQPAWGRSFSRYMDAFARHVSPDLVARVRLPEGATRLLDLGGSHGLHSMAFCRAYPNLSAVIVDHASALTGTGAALSAAGLADRISLKPGDLRDEEWGTDYDVVLLLSIAHNHTAADNVHILERIAGVLKPGGLLVIYEYPADEPMSPYVAAFHLVLLTETGSKPWAASEIQGWLAQAGFSAATAHPLDPIDKGTLFTATRLG